MRHIFIFSTLLIYSILNGQNFSRCDIYQYKGTDSSQIYLSSKLFYNLDGRIAFKIDNVCLNIICEEYYFYKDSLLIKKISIDKNHDSLQTFYTYNKKRQLIKSERFELINKLKEGVDKGYGRPGGCILTKDDYEEEKTWVKFTEIIYKYDHKGNKILEDATKSPSYRYKHAWKYDDKKRIVEHCSYNVDSKTRALYYLTKYDYNDSGYKYTRTGYDAEGKPRQFKTKPWEYAPQVTNTFWVNRFGNIVKEIVSDEKGKIYSIYVTEYNTFNKISKRIIIGNENKLLLTEIFQYIE